MHAYLLLMPLHHALPQPRFAALSQQLAAAEQRIRKLHGPSDEQEQELRQARWQHLLRVLEELQQTQLYTPQWLSSPEVRELVQEAFDHHRGQAWELDALRIVPHHLLALLRPVAPGPEAAQALLQRLHSLKGRTAKWANLHLHRTGEPFWHRHHLLLPLDTPEELQRAQALLEQNC